MQLGGLKLQKPAHVPSFLLLTSHFTGRRLVIKLDAVRGQNSNENLLILWLGMASE
jgi:hypothetical protein